VPSPDRRRSLLAPLLLGAALLAVGPRGARAATEADIAAVTREIVCYCGCSHQTVAECTCDTAEAIRSRVAGQLDSGLTPAQVIDAWVAERGEQILAIPPRRGFNLVGWIMPFVVVLTALSVLTVILLRRSTRPAAAAPSDAPLTDEERAYLLRVEREALSRER
jgi:cytochrome c-type biogenesis protein CcmH